MNETTENQQQPEAAPETQPVNQQQQEAQPVTESPVRKSDFYRVIKAPLAALISKFPMNESIRAMVMAECGKLVPEEADTFEKIKDWIEFNVEKKQTSRTELGSGDGITLRMGVSQMQYGRCRYSCNASYSGNVTIGRRQLYHIIHDAVLDGYSTLRDVTSKVIEEMADIPDMDDASDYEYEHHDCSDLDSREVFACNENDARRLVEEFIESLSEEQRNELEDDGYEF